MNVAACGLAPVKLIIITFLRRLFCKELEWQLNILKCKQNNLSISSLLVETKVSQIELCFSSLDKCFPIVKILCSLIYEVPTNIFMASYSLSRHYSMKTQDAEQRGNDIQNL